MPQILSSRADSVVSSTAEQALQPVVAARNGGYAVFWASPIADRGSSSAVLYANADIKGRLFDAAGVPVGEDFLVNITTAGAQYRPAAIRLSDGHLLVAWQDGVLSGSGNATLRAREFTGDGVPVGSEFVIAGPANAILPNLTPLAGGGFAAVWLSPIGGAISLQRFNAANVAVAPVITVGTSAAAPDVQTLTNGHVIVTWLDDLRVRGQLYDAQGAPVGAPLAVPLTFTGSSHHVVALADGGFAIVAQLSQQMEYSLFDAAMAPTATGRVQIDALTFDLVAQPEGGFAIIAAVTTLDGAGDIVAQAIERDGTAAGGPVLINPAISGGQQMPSAAVLDDGRLVVAWAELGTIGLGDGRIRASLSALQIGPASEGADTLTGSAGPDRADGLGGNDLLIGLAGPDTLYGDAGDDTMVGGAGDDVLGDGIGSNWLDGGDGNDTIYSAGANTVIAGAGNDVINAYDQAPGQQLVIFGGSGNDEYSVADQAAIIFEDDDGGYDRVLSNGSFYLYAGIEYLSIGDSSFFEDAFGVGNEIGNTIIGNVGRSVLIGLAGNDTLDGNQGDDALFGGEGHDRLLGDAGIDFLDGGEGNDTLDGGYSPDALYGGDGDDVLIGGDVFNGVTIGASRIGGPPSTGSSVFTADFGDDNFHTDILVGGGGNDTLRGASGLGDYDLLNGGAGDDVYDVDTPADLTFEAADEGSDTVIADIDGAGYYLYPHVENLILEGATPFGVGNDLANGLTGNTVGNYLLGGAGNDTLNGKGGGDVLFGEAGADTFVFEAGTGGDVIGDFQAGTDRIDLRAFGFASYAAVAAGFVEVAGTSAINLGNGDFIVINGVTNAQLTAASFLLG